MTIWAALALCAGQGTANASICSEAQTVDLVAEEYTTYREADEQLACLEENLLSRGDRRAIFASVYSLTTHRVAEGIDSAIFSDREWLKRYQTAFANFYRSAFYNYEVGNLARVPTPWRIAFDAARSGETLIIQDVLLGMNAHINYDLAYTLESVGASANRPAKRADHTQVNRILFRISDEILGSLGSIYGSDYALLDDALGGLDELLLSVGMATARANAWENGTALEDSRWYSRWLFEWWLDKAATSTAELTLAMTTAPGVRDALRRLEGSNPGSTFCGAFPCRGIPSKQFDDVTRPETLLSFTY